MVINLLTSDGSFVNRRTSGSGVLSLRILVAFVMPRFSSLKNSFSSSIVTVVGILLTAQVNVVLDVGLFVSFLSESKFVCEFGLRSKVFLSEFTMKPVFVIFGLKVDSNTIKSSGGIGSHPYVR